MDHAHRPNRQGGIFCECGKVVDRAGLRQVAFRPFVGTDSINPRVEWFLESGEPGVLKRDWPMNKPVEEMPDRSVNPAPPQHYQAPEFLPTP